MGYFNDQIDCYFILFFISSIEISFACYSKFSAGQEEWILFQDITEEIKSKKPSFSRNPEPHLESIELLLCASQARHPQAMEHLFNNHYELVDTMNKIKLDKVKNLFNKLISKKNSFAAFLLLQASEILTHKAWMINKPFLMALINKNKNPLNLNLLAIIAYKNKNYNRALCFIEQAADQGLIITKKLKAIILGDMSIQAKKQGEPDLALTYLNDSLAIHLFFAEKGLVEEMYNYGIKLLLLDADDERRTASKEWLLIATEHKHPLAPLMIAKIICCEEHNFEEALRLLQNEEQNTRKLKPLNHQRIELIQQHIDFVNKYKELARMDKEAKPRPLSYSYFPANTPNYNTERILLSHEIKLNSMLSSMIEEISELFQEITQEESIDSEESSSEDSTAEQMSVPSYFNTPSTETEQENYAAKTTNIITITDNHAIEPESSEPQNEASEQIETFYPLGNKLVKVRDSIEDILNGNPVSNKKIIKIFQSLNGKTTNQKGSHNSVVLNLDEEHKVKATFIRPHKKSSLHTNSNKLKSIFNRYGIFEAKQLWS